MEGALVVVLFGGGRRVVVVLVGRGLRVAAVVVVTLGGCLRVVELCGLAGTKPAERSFFLRSGSLLSNVLGWNPLFLLSFLPLFPFPPLLLELLLPFCAFCCLLDCVLGRGCKLPTAPTWFSPNFELTRRTSGYISRNC